MNDQIAPLPSPNLDELLRRIGGIDADDLATVLTAGVTWGATAAVLTTVRERLEEAAPRMIKGFGDTEVGRAGRKAFLDAAAKIGAREEELRLVAERLVVASDKLDAAHRVASAAPAQPRPPVIMTAAYGDPRDVQTRMHAQAIDHAEREVEVRRFFDADQEAGVRLAELKAAYADTTAAMGLIQPPEEAPDTPSEVRQPEPRHRGRGPESGPGGPDGLPPAVLGGGSLAAGLFGMRGLLGRLTPTTPSGTGGAGAAGAMRGAATAGAPVTRGGGGRGGAAGSRAGLAGRGRRKNESDTSNRDLFDDGTDWLDDEGGGPAVLGRLDA